MALRDFLQRAVEGCRLLRVSTYPKAPPIPEVPQKEKILERVRFVGTLEHFPPFPFPPTAAPKREIKPPPRAPKPPAKPVETRIERIIEKPEIKPPPTGYEIPEEVPRRVRLLPVEELRTPLVKLTYPLIPLKPKPEETVFAYAKIYFDAQRKRYVYELVEPRLTPFLQDILKKTKELLEQRLDVDLTRLKKAEATEYLSKEIEKALSYFELRLSKQEKEVLRYFIQRDFTGLGKIEPFMCDPNIEDISCDGVGIPIFVFHRDPRLGSLVTNVEFETAEELDSFVTRLAQLAGKSISISSPLLEGSLPDGSRVHATLATDIARRGSNFTIRKFTAAPLTPTHLLNFKTLDEKALAYLWLAVDYGRSILVAGGTASGKTTLLNVLSLFIRPEKKIISIEDTAELHLPHTHWVPEVARVVVAERGGEVDLFELLRGSFRQRPDYIIVGEVRGREAYILFQQITTGHPSLATIHAEDMQKLADRLTTEPISLPPTLIGSLDIVVFMQRMRYKEKFVRRVTEIAEMISFDPVAKVPVVNYVMKWDPVEDRMKVTGKSLVFRKIAEGFGLSEEFVLEEFKRRAAVLRWMKERNITDFREVYKILSTYYTAPNMILSKL